MIFGMWVHDHKRCVTYHNDVCLDLDLWPQGYHLMDMHPHTKYHWPISKDKKVMVRTSFAEKQKRKKKIRPKQYISPFVRRWDIIKIHIYSPKGGSSRCMTTLNEDYKCCVTYCSPLAFVVCTLLDFNLLLWNHLANWNRAWYECSLNGFLQNLCCCFKRGCFHIIYGF
jgi:hypothetical protein